MKKTWLLLLLLLTAAALLTGCASNADTLATPTPGASDGAPTASPAATDGMLDLFPQGSASPDASSAPAVGAGGIATVEDAKKASEAMEDALDKLTEVDEAHVVATGNTAVVGLKFTSQYQGHVDDRMKKMVLTRVQTVDKTITGVAVTADAALIEKIDDLADTLDSAASLSAVATQADELASQITVYTE